MKRRRLFSFDILLICFAVACIVMAVLLCVANPRYLAAAAGLLAVLVLLLLLDVKFLRGRLRRLLAPGKAGEEPGALIGMELPAAALSGGKVVWYNEAFRQQIAGGEDVMLRPVQQVLPGLELALCGTGEGQDIKLGQRRYTAFANAVVDADACLVLLMDDTLLKHQASEYLATRPAVMYIDIDTYDDVLKQMRESERTPIIADVNTLLEKYFGRTSGFLRRVGPSRYVAIVEEQHLKKMSEDRFDLLDAVRGLPGAEGLVTLSIGIGRQWLTLREGEAMAQQALDMALGRGGDQAAVKSPDGYTFYGGVSRSVEKRTRVKSRTMATAIRNLVMQSGRVLVMGHKQSDMDSLGAAVGMLRFVKACGKPGAVVINANTTVAGPLLQMLRDENLGEDFVPPEVALQMAGAETLLIVVDTHVKHLLESEDVYRACGNVVVIDHHRKMVEHIDNAVVFYHEPYASSASELVSELLQYVTDTRQQKPQPPEAEALLAGIMLDTRTFSLHTGVRTFEAAAYLRRMGARTEVVKRLFATTLEDYAQRSHLVERAQVYEGCAVVVSEELAGDAEIVTAQAANDLLGIEGVQASFVAVRQPGYVRVSARSMGEVNVQVILEKLGGGGHLTMAGAQVRGESLEEVHTKLMQAIREYRAAQMDIDEA